MTALAVIPARGGSKGIPLKNLQVVGGLSLLERAIRTCQRTPEIARTVVTSDHPEILRVAKNAGALTVLRPDNLSGDTAASEGALLHALRETEAAEDSETLVFVQCTSPFTESEDLSKSISLIEDDNADSVFSAVVSHDFLWREEASKLVGINHDILRRPMRQEVPLQYRETGGFYSLRKSMFEASRHRFFGRISPVVVGSLQALDIDEWSDLMMARAIADATDTRSDDAIFSNAKAVVWDFDGVHTDDSAFVDENGFESVKVNRSDGMGMRMLVDLNIPMLILSSEENRVVEQRAAKLRTTAVTGVLNKLEAFLTWVDNEGLRLDDVVYVGNDVNDLECLRAAGIPVAVSGSPKVVRDSARYCTTHPGGAGAVREIADLIRKNYISLS